MVSIPYLDKADLAPLADAAASWAALPAKYEALQREFEQRVINHLKGHWDGDAADAAFVTMGKARTEYENAATEAERIGKLLQDAHGEFAASQKQLHALLDEARDDHYKVSDDGRVEDVDPRWDSPTASASPGFAEERKKKLDSLVSRLTRVLEVATAADEAASSALERDANGDSESFNTSVYTTLDAVEADQAAALMNKKGRLSDAEITKLNLLLSANKNDPEFSRDFAVKTGGENMLSKYNELMSPPAGTTLSKAQLAQLKELKANLGTTIGTATTSDDHRKGGPDPEITKFQNDLLKAGQRDFNANPTESPYGLSGYQLTSSLMSEGKWDKDFLQDYGDALITADKNAADAGQNPDAYWGYPRTLGTTNIGALDPMAGYMDALGHNPEASTEFFGSETTVNGEKVDHYDYLMKDRHWPEGAGYTGDPKNPNGYNNLGHALESAVTGHSYDSSPSADTPAHNQDQAALMQKLVQDVSDDGELAHDGMQDSLGRMTAEYMPDVYRGLRPDGESEEDFLPLGNSVSANFSERDITRFMYTVGQDPDGYAAISYGQTQYSAELMNYHLSHPDAYGLSDKETIYEISETGAQVDGILSLGRQDSAVQESAEGDKVFNDRLASAGDWGKSITSIGIGVGTAAITSPVGGAVAGEVAGNVSGQLIDMVVSDLERDSSDDALYASGADLESSKSAVQAQLRNAATISVAENSSGLNQAEIDTAVNNGAEAGNGYANDKSRSYAQKRG
ncbi:DUF6571 family protein [Streptomyces griseorubiginosus]|uniref:DUF6571 domain-containing protein n=1 Tax=Streptomyces griseorubiginosus TaxID=67304 RepID=A0AAI8PML3_9ACTN|nr:DUF6571 family protein [Streptomyces griseorubiginosus]AYC38120.1 hypothetical protein DWG14_02344 [Streptomyces griseorubiginosus]